MDNLKQKSIDGVIWNLVEKIGIQFIKIILGVILARLLTPADYGLIGLITVFFVIAMVFIDSGFSSAFIQKQDTSEIDSSTIFYFNLLTSFLFYLILWFVAPFIASFYNIDELTQLIRIMSIVLIINSFGLIQLTKLKKDVDFKRKTILNLISAVIAGTVGIIAALSNYGVWSIVIQELVRASIKSFGLWYFYKWRPLFVFSIKSLNSMLSFSFWALLSTLISSIFDNIYALVIGKFFPVAELGFYTKAKQFQRLASQTPSVAVGSVAFPVFSKMQEDKPALKNAIKKFIQNVMFFVAPISAILYVIAQPLFLILLTEKWLPIVPYFQLLLIVGLFYPINMINVQLLSAQGKMKLNFKLSMIKNGLRIINIMIMYKFGVIYIIYGEIVVSFFALYINTFYSKRFVNYGMIEQLKDVSTMVLLSSILAVIGTVIIQYIHNPYLQLILMIIFIVILYLYGMYCFNKTFLKNTIIMIKQKFIK